MQETQNLYSLLPMLKENAFVGKKMMHKKTKSVRQWTKDEDQILICSINRNGLKHWHLVANEVPNRTSKQCRERYFNHLDPKIDKKAWSSEEDEILLELRKKYGNKWSEIKQFMPGRTSNQIKNRYFSHFAAEEDVIKKRSLSAFKPLPVGTYLVINGCTNSY
ncbi:Uncharacterized protein QTN25_002302 [Entamoeba marina]